MKIRNILSLPVLSGALFLSSGALASDPIPPILPYEGVYQPQGTDERGLWQEADEQERLTRDSEFVIRDEALNTYVRGVLCKAVGEDRCGSVRLYIVRVPFFNAYMTPNGTMVVWSGLLLRMRNEAELASVLGHEFAHFEKRHGLQSFKKARGTTDLLAWANFTIFGGLIQQAAIGSFFSFSRENEKEADLTAAAYMSRADYPVASFADIWARLLDEEDATRLARNQKSKRNRNTPFFATHPTSLDRTNYLRDLAQSVDREGQDPHKTEFRDAIGPYWLEWMQDQLKLNDFGGTDYLLSLMNEPDLQHNVQFARGELYRQRGNPRDLVNAAEFYRNSIAAGNAPAEAHRGLGLSLLRSGVLVEGKGELRKYLELVPDASDAKLVQALVNQ